MLIVGVFSSNLFFLLHILAYFYIIEIIILMYSYILPFITLVIYINFIMKCFKHTITE